MLPWRNERLEPLDVSVAYVESDDHLPFEGDRFELILTSSPA